MKALRVTGLLAAIAAAGGVAGGCAGAPSAGAVGTGSGAEAAPAPLDADSIAWTSVRLPALPGELSVLELGPPDAGLTLVAAHGLAGSGLEFAPLASSLRGRDLRLVAPDFPGTGASAPVPRERYGTELFVSVLRELADRAGPAPVVLLGHSLGAKAAVVFASRYPEKVRALVLFAPYGLQGQEGRLQRCLARHPGLARAAASLNNRAAVRWGMRRAYFDRRLIPPLIAEHLMASNLAPAGREALPAVASAAIGVDPVDSLLPSLEQPCLIVWGREDRVLPSRAAARWASLIPRARLVLLDRSGHVPMAERPAETARALEAFLRDNGLLE